MKSMNRRYLFPLAISTLLLGSCRKTFNPSTAIDEKSALSNAGDIETATVGTYALFKNEGYVRSGHFLMEYPTDEVAQGQNSSDDLTRAYRYTHLVTSSHPELFWGQAYKAAGAANRIIEVINDDASEDLNQLKGENLYIRAMMHFNLVRIFGRPYSQGSGNNPGVPILKDGLTDSAKATLPRSTVKEVYDFVIADLLKAAELMRGGSKGKANPFASKEVAYALLSRVYLYKEDNARSIEYADKVINAGRYSLLTGSEYTNYFRGVPEGNKETIFCIRHVKTEDRGFSAIGSMYYSGDASGTGLSQAFSGWGEIYASKKYVDALNVNPGDLRNSFVSPYKVSGVLQLNTKLTPNTPMYYINKYNLQEGIVNLSSPVYMRLAEMYLNRAEANAKLGNAQTALDDVNKIRERAGLTGAALHTTASVAASGKTILDVVLEERNLELAFEGHRAYDLFRNNRPLQRNYPGSQVVNGNVNQTVQPSDNRVIFFVPQNEINKNPKLTQNP
ncbi:RagB/SusD family nutrient uptake outer membrane protein [Paraflavitalea sp. CAU 1676]|uniref:RagB/SusD family nutrient uptake outer membrane protein n=1 Tax=Paraflavitalea sp. CAU 1676 TaxID=3032598 RepID=UPI0023DAE24E|nr:RagB/SusD family nutrient uptake outer membrane protein [Paraflavitalea sp. CAU 1676]MDF2188555.1 RagB/SusD family nutrient uptake outer membrane protein [Paraflavitalea sp. CAU 1676]